VGELVWQFLFVVLLQKRQHIIVVIVVLWIGLDGLHKFVEQLTYELNLKKGDEHPT